MMRVSILLATLAVAECVPIVRRYSDLGGQPYTITRNSRSVRFNDRPALLLSGSIHYPRSTPQMWQKLFSEAKANGLNTVESYVFWNVHAPTQDGDYASSIQYFSARLGLLWLGERD